MEQTKIFFRIFPSVDHWPQMVQNQRSFKDFPPVVTSHLKSTHTFKAPIIPCLLSNCCSFLSLAKRISGSEKDGFFSRMLPPLHVFASLGLLLCLLLLWRPDYRDCCSNPANLAQERVKIRNLFLQESHLIDFLQQPASKNKKRPPLPCSHLKGGFKITDFVQFLHLILPHSIWREISAVNPSIHSLAEGLRWQTTQKSVFHYIYLVTLST